MSANWIVEHSYAIFGFVAGSCLVAATRYAVRRRNRGAKRSFIDYMLLWPILIEQHKNNATEKSNRFVITRMVIMIVLVLAAIIIDLESR